jgi:hypothetical protein
VAVWFYFCTMERLTQLFKLVRHAVRHHRKKASASISLTLAALGYLNLDKLQPLAEAVQAEAQALLMKHASRDVMYGSFIRAMGNPSNVEVPRFS